MGLPVAQLLAVPPHRPLTGQAGLDLAQLSLVPPLLPAQVQVALPEQTPALVLVAVPLKQALMLPLLHWPLTGQGALAMEQGVLLPPSVPVQVQLSVVPQAPGLNPTAFPAVQALEVPAQAPFTGTAQGWVLQD